MHGARHLGLDGGKLPKKLLRPCFSAIHHRATCLGPFRSVSGWSRRVTVNDQPSTDFGHSRIERRMAVQWRWWRLLGTREPTSAIFRGAPFEKVLLGSAGFYLVRRGSRSFQFTVIRGHTSSTTRHERLMTTTNRWISRTSISCDRECERGRTNGAPFRAFDDCDRDRCTM